MGLTINTVKGAAEALKQYGHSPTQDAADKEHKKLLRESTRPLGALHMGSSASPSVELVLDLKAQLGEALTWDERTERLWFVDSNSKRIYSCTEDGQDLFSISTPETVGTIALTTDQNILLAALNRSVYPVDIGQRKVGPAIATVPEEHGVEQMRFNDGKASPGGAFIVGRMHMQFAEGVPGRLYRLHWESASEGWFEELVGPDRIGLPNGLAWDGAKMYHADTYHRTITAYPTDGSGSPTRQSGQPARGDVIVQTPQDQGGPDGMCISREGRLWAAFPDAACIACYSPEDGKEVARVQVPVNKPTCATFGGPKLNKIFVSSMKEEGPDAAEHAGGLFVVQVPGEFGLAPAYKVKVPA